MNEQFQTKVLEYIDGLAKSLGVAAEYVFTTLVRQQFIEGVVYTSTWLAVLTLLAALMVIYVRKFSRDWYDADDWVFGLLPVLIFAGVPVILGLIFLPEFIMKMFNPEYYAIKTILDAIGGK
ncbi:hypothetical protein [Paenibacillus naphthalenovorans]|uniref:hypothetical protein n=1 Tax=Paenibacillus naphthalenovorans TaxID=162209 RepID=UPI003D2A6970